MFGFSIFPPPGLAEGSPAGLSKPPVSPDSGGRQRFVGLRLADGGDGGRVCVLQWSLCVVLWQMLSVKAKFLSFSSSRCHRWSAYFSLSPPPPPSQLQTLSALLLSQCWQGWKRRGQHLLSVTKRERGITSLSDRIVLCFGSDNVVG